MTEPLTRRSAHPSTTFEVLCGDARHHLHEMPTQTVALFNFSPRYLDLVDYRKNEGGWLAAAPGSWGGPAETILDYVTEHTEAAAEMYRVAEADATVCAEVGDIRDEKGKRLIPLTDFWIQILESVGFRLAEKIVLQRTLAIGRRSGNFKRHRGRPGYWFPDNVVSTLIVAHKGNPQARLRRDASPEDRIDMAWAERFLRNAVMLAPPRPHRRGHPCPQDTEVARAAILLNTLAHDRVCDPYAGRGTSGIEALRNQRSVTLIERVPRWARESQEALRDLAPEKPLHEGRRLVRGSQLWIPMDPQIQHAVQRSFQASSTTGVTERLRKMAREASRTCGAEITPELMALALRAERAIYAGRTPRTAKPRTSRRPLIAKTHSPHTTSGTSPNLLQENP